MYPPKFNLRHFMQHLAPGGYYLFQIVLLVLYGLWIIDSYDFLRILFKLNKVNSTALFFVFLIIGVVCYFIGVVLRLPSVNKVDKISGKSQLPKNKEKKNGIFFRILSQLPRIYWIRNLFSIKSNILNKKSLTFRVSSQKWYRNQASELLIRLAGENFQKIRDGDFLLPESTELKCILRGLWAADKFPYPLWITYTTYLRAGPSRHKEFKEKLWLIILETMCNDPKADFYTSVPFNRCKLFIMRNSEQLANEVYDREAIVRMMAGFYYGLDLGKKISVIIGIITFILLVMNILKIDWISHELSLIDISWHAPIQGLPHIIFLSIVMFIFNSSQLKSIIKNFRHLRMSESEIVFSSYVITLSKLQP